MHEETKANRKDGKSDLTSSKRPCRRPDRPIIADALRPVPPQRLRPTVFSESTLYDRPAPEAASAPAATDPRTLGQRLLRVWPYFRSHKGALGLAFLGALIAALTEPAIPALLQILLDEGFVAGSFPLWMVPVALMGLFAVRGLATFAAKYALSYVAAGAMVQLRRAMFEIGRASCRERV